jgi:hypothetical protein
MKTLINTTVILLSLLFISSCKNAETQKNDTTTTENEITNSSSENELTLTQLDYYMQIKNALVQSNLDATQSAAKSMLSHETNEKMVEFLNAIVTANNLADARSYFSQMTQVMEDIEALSGANDTVYKQFCPMAFNNTGGYWFSMEEEIRNPYYGNAMLKCGRVVEEIN